MEETVPRYDYACTDCDHRFEVVQSFSDDSLTVCPECEGKLRKVFSAVGVVFKGSGFYRTDSRSTANSTGHAATSHGTPDHQKDAPNTHDKIDTPNKQDKHDGRDSPRTSKPDKGSGSNGSGSNGSSSNGSSSNGSSSNGSSSKGSKGSDAGSSGTSSGSARTPSRGREPSRASGSAA